MNLTAEQTQEARELLNKLNNLYREKAELEMLKVGRESVLKDEIAGVCDIRNKQGELQPNKVKMPLIAVLIDELFLDKDNKKEQEYLLMDTYKKALLGDVNKEIINSYVALKESLDENNQDIKQSFKDTSSLDKDILEAINFIAKERYKELLESKKIEAGIEIKPPKDMSAILEIIKELEDILK